MNSFFFGILFHVAFFAIGLYMYLFARGIVAFGSEEEKARAEAFRKDNATWLRLLGLALAAIMALNVFFDVRAMMG